MSTLPLNSRTHLIKMRLCIGTCIITVNHVKLGTTLVGKTSWEPSLMVRHGGSGAGSYLADPTSPPTAVIIQFKTVPVHQLSWLALLRVKQKDRHDFPSSHHKQTSVLASLCSHDYSREYCPVRPLWPCDIIKVKWWKDEDVRLNKSSKMATEPNWTVGKCENLGYWKVSVESWHVGVVT